MKKLLSNISFFTFRYALGLLLILIGLAKFINADGWFIEQALASIFLFKWMLKFITLYSFTLIIGALQILAGIFIMLKPMSKKLSAWGGGIAAIFFFAIVFVLIASGSLWKGGVGSPLFFEGIESLLKMVILAGVSAWCWSDSL
jgi:reactive chlorine resistance protein C